MALPARRQSKDLYKPKHVNLVSARAEAYADVSALSRTLSADSYAKMRARRNRNRIITTVVTVTLIAALLAIAGAVVFYKTVLLPGLNRNLTTDAGGRQVNFKEGAYADLLPAPESLRDPFWMLLLGIDKSEDGGIPRTDTIILAYVDPQNQRIALVSIPRDMQVYIPRYGKQKINSAYTWGENDHINYVYGYRSEDSDGVSASIRAVEDFAGIRISYFATVDFDGFQEMVDNIGGVYVNVPVNISDREAGPVDITAGPQVLNGEQALTFVRSRKFINGDYQRQADQRTFLQALARQTLSSNPIQITNTVNSLSKAIHTNMQMQEIIDLALSMQGLQEYNIYTYTVPSYPGSDPEDGLSYMYVKKSQWDSLISRIDAGDFPDLSDYGLNSDYMGITPKSYNANEPHVTEGNGILTSDECRAFVVDVRNGWGVKGAASAVADMLELAGYQRGEVSNTNAFVYNQTFVVYENEADLPVAEDIALRLGCGTIIYSNGRYNFTGNVLVIVGEDLPNTKR